MKRELNGRYTLTSAVGGEKVRAFIPHPLPPTPPVQIDAGLQDLLDESLLALGRLDSVSTLLPDPSLFLYMYVRKEAVLSSQIEGTQSSLSDLLLFESEGAPGVPMHDVQEVSNYVAAMNHGLKRLRGGFPLSLRLIKEIHKVLLSKGRGSEKGPGELRRSQNWIGGTRPGNALFVPPPPDKVIECLGALEKFIHDDPVRTAVLLKAAMAHVQFETIHPFLDGNGRLGRLLVTLLLCAEGAMSEPMLYLSLYFKAHRQQYYDLLQKVRTTGDWEAWLDFFARGVKETADGAVQTARSLVAMFEKDGQRIQTVGRSAGSVLRVHRVLQQSPVASITKVAELASITLPTAKTALVTLEKMRITRELATKRRGRVFAYDKYLKVLSEGT